jgi:hypothetical protein
MCVREDKQVVYGFFVPWIPFLRAIDIVTLVPRPKAGQSHASEAQRREGKAGKGGEPPIGKEKESRRTVTERDVPAA